ncbi:hypothetical protein ACLKA7_005648 [Drosophila subpalustris]
MRPNSSGPLRIICWLDSNETCPNCRQPCAQALVRNAASDRRSGVQGNQGLPPPPNTGTVPKPRINTRSQARGNSNSQAFRSNPRRDSESAKPPDASDSSAMTEERIQRLISQSLDSYRHSMAAMISEQITAAVRNLNLAPPRQESHDEPQLEWENDIAPSFPRLSSVSNMRMRDDANSMPLVDKSTIFNQPSSTIKSSEISGCLHLLCAVNDHGEQCAPEDFRTPEQELIVRKRAGAANAYTWV